MVWLSSGVAVGCGWIFVHIIFHPYLSLLFLCRLNLQLEFCCILFNCRLLTIFTNRACLGYMYSVFFLRSLWTYSKSHAPFYRWQPIISGRNPDWCRNVHRIGITRSRHDIARDNSKILAGRTEGQRNQTLRHLSVRFRPPRPHSVGGHCTFIQRGYANTSSRRRQQFTLPAMQQQPQFSVAHKQSVHHETGQVQRLGYIRN